MNKLWRRLYACLRIHVRIAYLVIESVKVYSDLESKENIELVRTETQGTMYELWMVANSKFDDWIFFKGVRKLMTSTPSIRPHDTPPSHRLFFRNYGSDQHLSVPIWPSIRSDQIPAAFAVRSSVRKYMPSVRKYIFSDTSHFRA